MLSLICWRRGVALLSGQPHARLLLAGALLAGPGGGCERAPTGPIPTSYLAIVTTVDAPLGLSPGTRYAYKVRELSGTLHIDTTIAVAPGDTIIAPLPPATYGVNLGGLPTWCKTRYGDDQFMTVVAPPSTSLIRYFVSCRAPLTVRVATVGPGEHDPEMVSRLVGPDGQERLGIASANDTLRFDGLAPGHYRFGLSLVAANCVVTSLVGSDPYVLIVPEGGIELDVLVVCSDEAHRPQLIDFGGHFDGHLGSVAFQVADPDRDIERYTWDLTDCAGASVLKAGSRTRRGLSTSWRTRDQDSVTIVAAFEVARPDTELVAQPRCVALRVTDEPGNSTPTIERPLTTSGRPPQATMFNAYSVGTVAIRTQLAASDPDGDFVGVFAAARLRDGVLGPPDGNPDYGIYNVAGYLGEAIPDLPLDGRIQYGDVYAVIVYLIDAAGNVSRLEDFDVFR